jgi:hypothetical protein
MHGLTTVGSLLGKMGDPPDGRFGLLHTMICTMQPVLFASHLALACCIARSSSISAPQVTYLSWPTASEAQLLWNPPDPELPFCRIGVSPWPAPREGEALLAT